MSFIPLFSRQNAARPPVNEAHATRMAAPPFCAVYPLFLWKMGHRYYVGILSVFRRYEDRFLPFRTAVNVPNGVIR